MISEGEAPLVTGAQFLLTRAFANLPRWFWRNKNGRTNKIFREFKICIARG
jgi:hypothetical protein